MWVAASGAALDGATITVCVESQCATGGMPSVPPPSPDSGTGRPMTGAFRAEVWLHTAEDGSVDVDATVEPGIPFEIADGDVYTATLRAADGTILAARTWTATYTHDYVNSNPLGEPCGDLCATATLAPE